MLSQSRSTYEILSEFLRISRENGLPDVAFVEAAISQHMAVIVCSELEETLCGIVRGRLDQAGDPMLAEFISRNQQSIIKRINKTDIASTAKQFGSECKEGFNSSCEAKDVQLHSTVVNARHKTAHPGSTNITMRDIDVGIEATEKILKAFGDSLEVAGTSPIEAD